MPGNCHRALPHALVSACDLAIGAPIPRQLELNGWLDYVRAVADWRTKWDGSQDVRERARAGGGDVRRLERLRKFLGEERDAAARALINATAAYRETGVMPPQVYDLPPLRLVTSQTLAERADKKGPHRPFTGLVVPKPPHLK